MATAPTTDIETCVSLSFDIDNIQRQLRQSGYVLIRNGSAVIENSLSSFGTVVDVTDVEADDNRPGLVTSTRELDLHTDHGDIDTIALSCRSQARRGGESLLVDSRRVLDKLDDATKQALTDVYLTEHRVFDDDPERRPLLRPQDDHWKLYYSFWLVEEALDDRSTAALDAFREALEATEVIELKLRPGDVLLLDNTRMLHGRTAIEDGDRRHLKRHWIQRQQPDSDRGFEEAENEHQFDVPDPISDERIAELEARGVDPDVAALDLSMVKMKLQEPDEGKGWTRAECDEAELEYKRYLTLNIRYEDKAIVPTGQIDTIWHYHILDTRAYHRDCEQVFGEYFHHFPYFGMRGEEDAENLDQAFFETAALYEQDFGESMVRNQEVATDCGHDSQGRCWHACSND